MDIWSGLIISDITDYDHAAGVIPTLVWQMPTNAKTGDQYFFGNFLNNAAGDVWWLFIKAIAIAPDTSADHSTEVSRLYT